MIDRTKKDWWKSAVFYQIYPKSFQDTNDDGIGDLPGIIEHLDYLQKLGVDGIWICPFFVSPMRDNGYDIADYLAVDPLFGTMEDFERLVAEAEARGMIIILDMVINHTSNEHPWFIEAKKSKDNPYHDFYIWRDGEPDVPPNDLVALFAGSSWTYVPELGQYYYSFFSEYQPDLNWDNPKVRETLFKMMRTWVGRNAGGFRIDAIRYISKDLEQKIVASGPHLHEYIREMKKEAFPETEIVSIGEDSGATLEEARLYSDPDGSEFSMIFQFGTVVLDYGTEGTIDDKWELRKLYLPDLKKYYETWQQGLYNQGWNSLFLSNHDLPRAVSHWGNDKEWRVPSAKMLAVMIHGMQGTPYIFQGEEIGMTNTEMPIEDYDDIEIKDFYARATRAGRPVEDVMRAIYARGRDNARTPMQWSDAPYAGFSKVKPWMPVNGNYKTINAEDAVDDPDSIFYFYQKLIALRKEYPIFREGSFTLLDPENEYTFCYTRDSDTEHMLVECNFTDKEQPASEPDMYKNGKVLIANYDNPHGPLRPYEARMVYVQD